MKQLFIFLISTLFLSASLYSNTGTVSKELSIENGDSRSFSPESLSHSAGYDLDAIVNRPVYKTASTAHGKLIRWTPFVDAYLLTLSASADYNKAFFQPYLYCKPISLRLIFPQHYFW
ncbi:MAG: hypothetical protein INR73_02225 [Williamsia sp.]|nr:hypothetical protein [Williamsia sp.]